MKIHSRSDSKKIVRTNISFKLRMDSDEQIFRLIGVNLFLCQCNRHIHSSILNENIHLTIQGKEIALH